MMGTTHQYDYIIKVVQDVEPTCFEDAIGNENRENAMDEMAALDVNQTWELVPLPKGKKAIGCKWVYKVKHKVDGTIERYKARLVTKGYAQTYGIDYEETFAPVAKMATVRIVMAVLAAKGWFMHQMHVKNFFLQGKLQEEVYVEHPPSYEDYDLIIVGDDETKIEHGKGLFKKEFERKDLGELRYFLGLEVLVQQRAYGSLRDSMHLDMLFKYGMADCKPISMPLDVNTKLSAHDGDVLKDLTMYCRIVGSLIYLTIMRSDLSYTMGLQSQFM
ncbi:hypothetical protein L7F22_005474 [Adiantum nelumboides]|nr:hypothetical protein [Adiantum nelumboides]